MFFFSTDYTNYTVFFWARINTNLVSFLQNYGYTLLFYDYPQTAQIWNRVSYSLYLILFSGAHHPFRGRDAGTGLIYSPPDYTLFVWGY